MSILKQVVELGPRLYIAWGQGLDEVSRFDNSDEVFPEKEEFAMMVLSAYRHIQSGYIEGTFVIHSGGDNPDIVRP